ncbi:hypothetical protein ACPOL_4687 [Acidisarcina polymorpha]|uniref:1,4-beta-xylanase n=2 Tax=Acidisarcina polymorpha TaxID=2211140 RepID=A0A2Z5G599_9BACT|nr:hypothetical protein ACPOL_4687 [Acidisarcina polymorpha]
MICFGLLSISAQSQEQGRWSEQRANEWYAKQPWLVGANYIPSNAIDLTP